MTMTAPLATLLSTILVAAPTAPHGASRPDTLPLEPTRSVHIDLTEGSWMSVDVSPDGSRVVFDYLGDLFLVPIGGGTARPLTSGMAFDAQPRFSPDGRSVVFTSDRSGGQNIWTMALDGSDTTQVSTGDSNRAESPEWTPDGRYVVASMGGFRFGGPPKLHLYHVDGGAGAKLIDEPENLKTLGPAFGPDERWIWFARRTGDWQYNAQLPQYQLAVYDRDTGEVYGRTSRNGSAFRPTLSPDGRWLAYGTRFETETGIMLRDLGSGEERWLAYPVQHDDQESRATLDVLPGMSFTPDSRFLVASYGGRIWKLPVDGGAQQEIPFRVTFDLAMGPAVDFDYPVDDAPTFTVRQIRDPVPSPDGSRIAFSAMDRLWVANADGSSPRRLTDTDASEHFPAWSPDGRQVAFAAWEGSTGHLYAVRSDGGSAPRRLTEQPGVYASPAWSPDGQRVVALRGQPRAFTESSSPGAASAVMDDVVWVPAAGGEVSVVAPAEDLAAPHFRADEAGRVYLFHEDDGLVSMRFDGTDRKEHLKVTGLTPAGADEPMDPDVVLMAPRGDQALARIQNHVFTVTVPRVGGDAPTISVSNPDNAAFPARQVTVMGGEFPSWSADGRKVHFALGNAFFTYDLDAARAHEDSVQAARRARGAAPRDTASDGTDDEDYEAREVRVRIQAERDVPSGTAVLRGARIVTMRGDEVIEDGDVVVRDNRIAAVGPRGSVTVPDGARVIDVSGHTIVPGFVDTHAHMWPTWGMHRTDQWIYMANLAYGVTTTRDPQTATTDVLTYADLVRAGEIVGPRIYSTGPGVFWQESVKSLDHARDVLRRYSDYYDTKTLKMYVAGNRKQRQWIIQAAREAGIMPTTEGSLNFKQDITETVDGYSGLEHALPIYPLYDDVVRLFAASGRTYTPTLLVSYGGPWAENWYFETEDVYGDTKLRHFTPTEELAGMALRRGQWFSREEYVFDDHARFVADLVEAGGKVGVGSHGQLQGLGYHWELWSVQSGGLAEHDALRVATIFGAQALGLDGDLGSIEAGKLADLVVLRDNPLVDIRNTNTVHWVMKNGRLYGGDTLDEVYPRQRALANLWWWDRAPAAGRIPGVPPGN